MADDKAKASDKAKAPVIIIKKGGHGGHGHHGGAWKVAYADFVTAMMAFFLVMWLMGADEETKQAIEKYFTQATDTTPMEIQITDLRAGEQMAQMDTPRKPAGRPVDLPAGKHSAETQEDAEIREKIEEALSVEVGVTSLSEDVKIVQGQDNETVVRIAIKDLFRAGSSRAEADLLPLIQRLGKIVAQTGRAVRIEGHADTHETSDTGGNLWELSNARAAWLADYWVNQLNDPQLGPRLQVVGHGSHKPVEKGDTPQGQAANRRVEVIVLKAKPPA